MDIKYPKIQLIFIIKSKMRKLYTFNTLIELHVFYIKFSLFSDYCQKSADSQEKPKNITRNVLQIKDKTESSIMCFIEDHLRIDFIFIDCISFIFHFIFLSFFRAIIYLWHL